MVTRMMLTGGRVLMPAAGADGLAYGRHDRRG